MRIADVHIENFLSFRSLGLPVDPQLQMLAGPNNAGKSSFVRLLEAFFSDPSPEDLLRLLPRHEYYLKAGPRILSSITISFADLSEDEIEAVGDAYRKRDKTIWISLRCGRTGRISFTASKASQEEARRLYEYVLDQYQFVKIPSVRVGGAGDSDQFASLERLMDTMESVLIRRTPGPEKAIQKQFNKRVSALEEVVKEVLDESARAIGANLPFQDGSVTFTLDDPRHALRGILSAATIESHEGTVVPVSERGTGFQSALVLGMLRYIAGAEGPSAVNVLFAIEEPEAFLHPQTQRAMTKVLKEIAEDAQVVVTTHSPVVVDTFRITQIARLPLMPKGTEFTWEPPDLDGVQEGRLTRYCDAKNSELIFASAVILVEGEGDYLVVEHLLDDICDDVGGHYARGVTVIEAGGIGRIKRLLELAEHFGVRVFVLVDRDGLDSENGRKLIDILKAKHSPPRAKRLNRLRDIADKPMKTYKAALVSQAKINRLLEPFDAFVMVSDLEGMLLDTFEVTETARLLGPDELEVIDQDYIDRLDDMTPDDAYEHLRRRIGSKGWDGGQKPTKKLAPHVPRLMIEKDLDQAANLTQIERLEEWLEGIVESVAMAAI